MRKKNKNKGDVEWYLKGKKRPFAYSTTGESDTVSVMLGKYGDLRTVLRSCPYLSDNERIIINTFIKNGEYCPALN